MKNFAEVLSCNSFHKETQYLTTMTVKCQKFLISEILDDYIVRISLGVYR